MPMVGLAFVHGVHTVDCRAENPYTAAQRFLAANDLPMHHLDEVAQFIQQNASGVTLGASSEYVDPFTGASSYRAGGGSSSAAAPSGNYVDPFTGSSRYTGAPAPAAGAASAYQDPFTGASRYQSNPPPAPAKPKIIPAVRLMHTVPWRCFADMIPARRGDLQAGERNGNAGQA